MRDDRSDVTEAEADAAFDCLKRYDHVVLAVSGGPDSMALMLLAARWRLRRGGTAPTISVATVDHRLRAESTAEAVFVGRVAAELQLDHTILMWLSEKPLAGVPDAARRARYRLLEEHANALGIGRRVAIVTAHHLDDQAETFAMRLARGSGVNGLAAMRAVRPLTDDSGIDLVRPLLSIEKCRLVATLEEAGVPSFDDPTNVDGKYERARVRQAMAALNAAGISSAAIALSARRLGEAEAALRFADDQFRATLGLTFGNDVFGQFARDAFRAGPELLGQRLMSRLIARYGGASERPRLDEIENLTERLRHESKCTATLGGAMVTAGQRFIRIWREAGRLVDADLPLQPGESKIWDRRFRVTRFASAAGPVTVRALGAKDYPKICETLISGGRPPARAAHALPAFWAGDRLVAVPSLMPFVRADVAFLEQAGCGVEALEPSAAPY
ncbi:tRNA lysidine(34) synthetase TilS [Hyphomicrobium methylovorum]|uniref:tRNA lysidine(34) synthetase TilS n=1 Tax=Hyphomicrobium methylovorum TaxID=84 RepID=UPI001FE77895|nr:tRNA lysidine(34) synthetase TilS [Hyphomicrobium methylovorum]